MPTFRKGVLALECTEQKKQDSILYQLQTMFGYLQERLDSPAHLLSLFVRLLTYFLLCDVFVQ
jgi:hypothetical protein